MSKSGSASDAVWMEKLFDHLSVFLNLDSWDLSKDGYLNKGCLEGKRFLITVFFGGVDQSVEVIIKNKLTRSTWDLSKTAQLEGVLQWMIDNRAESKSPEHTMVWIVKYFREGLRGHSQFSKLYRC